MFLRGFGGAIAAGVVLYARGGRLCLIGRDLIARFAVCAGKEGPLVGRGPRRASSKANSEADSEGCSGLALGPIRATIRPLSRPVLRAVRSRRETTIWGMV